jgi:hypothetical protein
MVRLTLLAAPLSSFDCEPLAGQIGSKNETDQVRKVLRVLALIQPFYPEDQTILEVVANVEGLEAHDVSRLVRALTEAGVLFRRGGRYAAPVVGSTSKIYTSSLGKGARVASVSPIGLELMVPIPLPYPGNGY